MARRSETGRIRVEGLAELKRAIRGRTGLPLRQKMAQANKQVGALIIQRLSPRPATSGEGRGATVRPRARAFDVTLAVGGSHRKSHRQQWGVRFVPRTGPRAFILGTALQQQDQIEQDYLDGVVEALAPAFWKADS